MKEEITVIETKAMSLQGTIDVTDASRDGLALMEERVANQIKMLKIALSLTSPNQWQIFENSVYPTGGASDTVLRRAFGLTWGEKVVTIEETKEGTVATAVAWLMRGSDRVEQFTGKRTMRGFVNNKSDLTKGAIENMKSVALRDLLGLRGRKVEEIRALGVDLGNVSERRVSFQNHEKQSGEFKVPFGKSKGKNISDVEDSEITWLAEATKKSIEDPEKAKFKTKNEQLLSALREEYKKRHGHDTKTGEVKTEAQIQLEEELNRIGPPPMTDNDVAF